MANPHFQNQIQWAGNTVATKAKKDQPMFMPLPSDQTHYGYFNDFYRELGGNGRFPSFLLAQPPTY